MSKDSMKAIRGRILQVFHTQCQEESMEIV
jgi:hypothetical protein